MSETRLQDTLDQVVRSALLAFKKDSLAPENLALSIIYLPNQAENQPLYAHFRGHEGIYPASIVKLFYLVAVHQWLEEGKLSETLELRRAMHNMIVDSSNDATSYIVDLLTDTASGPEFLDEQAKQAWVYKRNAVNRYFASAFNFEGINLNQKTWEEGPYGREREFMGEQSQNKNLLTTNVTAKLLLNIVSGQIISPVRSRAMMELLERDRGVNHKQVSLLNRDELLKSDPHNQALAFTGAALPLTARLWSKAGWTSKCRHDAAYIEIDDQAVDDKTTNNQSIDHRQTKTCFILVTFTLGQAQNLRLIPYIAQTLIEFLTNADTAIKLV